MKKETNTEKNKKNVIDNGEYGELEVIDLEENEEKAEKDSKAVKEDKKSKDVKPKGFDKEEKSKEKTSAELRKAKSKEDDAKEAKKSSKEVDETDNEAEKEEEVEAVEESEERTIKDEIGIIAKYFLIMVVSLIYWEIIMQVQFGKWSPSSLFFLFFIPAQALVLTTLAGIGNKLSAKITLPIVLAIPAVFYTMQIIYLKNFGSLVSISLIGMGNDALGNFGWAVTDSVVGSVFQIFLVFIPVIAAIVLAFIKKVDITSYKLIFRLATIILSAVLWLVGMLGVRAFGNDRLSPYYMLTSKSATTDAAAKKIGTLTTSMAEAASYYFGINDNTSSEFVLEEDEEEEEVLVVSDTEDEGEEKVEEHKWMNEAIDFNKIASETDDDNLKSLAGYFATRKASTTNEYTGMFEGYNLIYICAESFWSYACNEKVTPTLYKMANNGIVLNNYYNSFYNTTTNGEFAFATSLWPDVSRNSKNGTDIGSFAQSSTKFMPQGLGDLFTAQGINSYGFHNYYGKYYRRILSWPNLGYKTKFTGDDGMYFTSNWPASDLELMEQTVDDFINDDQFHAYYMTFSGHGPYTAKNKMYNKNMPMVNSILGTEEYTDMARGYLAGELELDMAMEYLLNRLEEAGKLENTVIVLTSDHYPYYLEKEARDSLTGYEMDEDFEIYKSNCIIYCAGIEEPIEVDNYCCNIDIAPTVCNLFNIPFESRLMIGRDIFSKEAHNRATLYNMSFIDEYVKYNYETGEAIWSDKGNTLSDEEKQKHIETNLNSIENEYTAACRAIEENFFFDVYIESGLLTDEEIAAEKERAANAQNQDDTFNAEDEAEKAEKEAQKRLQQQIDAGTVTLDENGNAVMVVPDPNAIIVDPLAVPVDGTLGVPAVDGTVETPAVDGTVAAPVVDPNAVVIPDQTVVDPNAALVIQ